jgi:hypothetical protein
VRSPSTIASSSKQRKVISAISGQFHSHVTLLVGFGS